MIHAVMAATIMNTAYTMRVTVDEFEDGHPRQQHPATEVQQQHACMRTEVHAYAHV